MEINGFIIAFTLHRGVVKLIHPDHTLSIIEKCYPRIIIECCVLHQIQGTSFGFGRAARWLPHEETCLIFWCNCLSNMNILVKFT